MGFIDVHCHLDLRQFDADMDNVIERARKAGVSAIVQNSLNPASIAKSIAISDKNSDIVRLALGLYPVDALKLSDEEIDKWVEFIKKHSEHIIAIGEVGLDYHWVKDKKEQERQRKIFEKFIALAEHSKKPLIVHSRESEHDAFDMLQSSDTKAIFHCFNGSLDLTKKCEESGYFFSIPASITFIKAFQDLARQADLNHLFCETDAPYMSPFRGKRNEPAFVVESYKKIAAIKKKSIEEISEEISQNYGKLFMK